MRPFWPILAAVFLIPNVAPAQQNKVLELDGYGSYVELPPNIFSNLTQATVEVWAKWDTFRTYSRVFEFGAGWQSMCLFNHDRTSDLRYNLYPLYAKHDRSLAHTIRVGGLLTGNEWIHIAAVSGPGGMKLYANGVLVGEHTNAASFADIKTNQTNVFGTGLAKDPGNQDFRGQMDEIRVWNHRRTEAQIRENMHKRLTGREEGLVALLNFEDGTANDSSPNAFRGRFLGNARVVTAGADADARLWGVPPPAQPNAAPATVVNILAPGRDLVGWWIAAALTLLVALVTWLVLLLRRSSLNASRALPAAPAQGLLPANVSTGAGVEAVGDQKLKERALAELTEFAKESLVQGLYSQRKALLETQQDAQRQLTELEARISALRLPDRIQAYEKRIAELEKELETRSGEVRELTSATLLLLRRKLQEEKQLERTSNGFAT